MQTWTLTQLELVETPPPLLTSEPLPPVLPPAGRRTSQRRLTNKTYSEQFLTHLSVGAVVSNMVLSFSDCLSKTSLLNSTYLVWWVQSSVTAGSLEDNFHQEFKSDKQINSVVKSWRRWCPSETPEHGCLSLSQQTWADHTSFISFKLGFSPF